MKEYQLQMRYCGVMEPDFVKTFSNPSKKSSKLSVLNYKISPYRYSKRLETKTHLKINTDFTVFQCFFNSYVFHVFNKSEFVSLKNIFETNFWFRSSKCVYNVFLMNVMYLVYYQKNIFVKFQKHTWFLCQPFTFFIQQPDTVARQLTWSSNINKILSQ